MDDPFDPIKVTVNVDTKRVFSGKINGGAGKSAFTWTTKFEGTGNSKRVWTRPEPGIIGCDDPATRLLLDWGYAENVEGLALAVEDDRTSTRAATSLDGTPIYARKTIIKGKRNNAVIVGEEDWNAIQETLYVLSVPGLYESILEGQQEPLEEMARESDVDWS